MQISKVAHLSLRFLDISIVPPSIYERILYRILHASRDQQLVPLKLARTPDYANDDGPTLVQPHLRTLRYHLSKDSKIPPSRLRHNHDAQAPRLPNHTPRNPLQAQPTQSRLTMLDLRNLIHMLQTDRADGAF